MKLSNTTPYPDYFLRRLVAWCCKQMDCPLRTVGKAQFRNRYANYRGRATYATRRILVATGEAGFPTEPDNRPGMQGESFADRTEALVAVTAHEIYHLAAHFVDGHRQRTRRGKTRFASSEQRTRVEEVRLLRLFRSQREELLAAWNEPPAQVQSASGKPKLSAVDRRAAKADRDLARWQRKLKLAQTKVKKLKTRVRYYEKSQAAKASGNG